MRPERLDAEEAADRVELEGYGIKFRFDQLYLERIHDEWREDDYTWTKPYVDNSQVVVVRKDSGITQLNDLSGKVVAVQADSSALAALTGEMQARRIKHCVRHSRICSRWAITTVHS